jgi:hypothetical protein
MIDIFIFLFVVAMVFSLAAYTFDKGFKAGSFEEAMNHYFELERLEVRIAQLQRKLKESAPMLGGEDERDQLLAEQHAMTRHAREAIREYTRPL